MHNFFFFLSITVIFSFCKKENAPIIVPSDPPVVIDTPIIALGKISMLLNGQSWDFPLKTKKYVVKGVASFGLSGRRTDANGIEQAFNVVDIPYKKGKYRVEYYSVIGSWGNSIPQSVMSWILDGDQNIGGLEVDTTKTTNFVEVIRYDSVQNIAEGRFQVSLKNYSSHPLQFGLPNSVSITEGKFHVVIPK